MRRRTRSRTSCTLVRVMVRHRRCSGSGTKLRINSPASSRRSSHCASPKYCAVDSITTCWTPRWRSQATRCSRSPAPVPKRRLSHVSGSAARAAALPLQKGMAHLSVQSACPGSYSRTASTDPERSRSLPFLASFMLSHRRRFSSPSVSRRLITAPAVAALFRALGIHQDKWSRDQQERSALRLRLLVRQQQAEDQQDPF